MAFRHEASNPVLIILIQALSLVIVTNVLQEIEVCARESISRVQLELIHWHRKVS